MTRILVAVERVLDRLNRSAGLLALPLAGLLCAQWPLRDVVGAGSRQANDMAQWIFAVYVAFAFRHATRVHGHLATDALASHYPEAWRHRIARWGPASCLLAWSLFVLVSASPPAWQALRELEAFPDTLNPGYFLIKCSVWLLALLVGWEALFELLAPRRRDTGP